MQILNSRITQLSRFKHCHVQDGGRSFLLHTGSFSMDPNIFALEYGTYSRKYTILFPGGARLPVRLAQHRKYHQLHVRRNCMLFDYRKSTIVKSQLKSWRHFSNIILSGLMCREDTDITVWIAGIYLAHCSRAMSALAEHHLPAEKPANKLTLWYSAIYYLSLFKPQHAID